MFNSLKNTNVKTLASFSDGQGKQNELSPVVLIVDDDDDSRLMLKILLEMWNYRVIEAKDASEAINITENNCLDLILLDVKMPDLDGFDVTQKIRLSAKTESVPIVFLSGCAEAVYKQRATAVGANEYLVKPLDFRELETTLGKYIHGS